MRQLRDQPPRPRSTTASPAYPRLMAAGLLAILSSACGGEVTGVPLPARQSAPEDPETAPVTSTAGLPPLPYTAPDVGAGAAPYLDEEPRGGSAGAPAGLPDPAGAGGFSFDEGQPSSGAAGASAEVPGPGGAGGAEPVPVYDP